MERLTERTSIGETIPRLDVKNNGHAKCMEKLADYEDLEEQDLLVKLPCKVGDTVYELCRCDYGVYRVFPMIVKSVVPYGGFRLGINGGYVWNIYAESENHSTYMYKEFYDFGKTVFLTKFEAEQVLAKLENGGYEDEIYNEE